MPVKSAFMDYNTRNCSMLSVKLPQMHSIPDSSHAHRKPCFERYFFLPYIIHQVMKII